MLTLIHKDSLYELFNLEAKEEYEFTDHAHLEFLTHEIEELLV